MIRTRKIRTFLLFVWQLKLALSDLKEADSKKNENNAEDEQEIKKKEFQGSSTEHNLRAVDVSSEINKHDPEKTPLAGDATSVKLLIDKRPSISKAKLPDVLAGPKAPKFKRAFSAVNNQTAIDTNETDTNETIPRKPYQIALETVCARCCVCVFLCVCSVCMLVMCDATPALAIRCLTN